jgi:hypothetical protein
MVEAIQIAQDAILREARHRAGTMLLRRAYELVQVARGLGELPNDLEPDAARIEAQYRRIHTSTDMAA